MKRASFWVLTLGVVPLGTFFTALAVEGSGVVQWTLLLVAPASSSIAFGWLLGARGVSIVAAAVLSTTVTWFYVLLLLWYLFEVVGSGERRTE